MALSLKASFYANATPLFTSTIVVSIPRKQKHRTFGPKKQSLRTNEPKATSDDMQE
jgi:hypothetical protein